MSGFEGGPPPPPPPLPPSRPDQKEPPFRLKARSAPPDWFYQAPIPPPLTDRPAAPTGFYFFYGTLMDPKMPTEILDLDPETKPELRPGKILGYETKLWGQYPALIKGPPGSVVEGMAYNVQTVEDGEKLAAYETRYYETQPCPIKYTDNKEPATEDGNVFMFAGDPRELSEGGFDLKVWLRRMGRGEAVDAMEAAKKDER